MPSPQNPSTDLTEIWRQFLPPEGRPSPNFGLSFRGVVELKIKNKKVGKRKVKT